MVQVFFILVLVVLIGFLLFFIVKNFAAPRKIEGIQKLIKQGKYSSAIKQAKAMITKEDLINDILKFVKHKKLTTEEFEKELKNLPLEALQELWVKAIETF